MAPALVRLEFVEMQYLRNFTRASVFEEVLRARPIAAYVSGDLRHRTVGVENADKKS